MKSTRAHRSRKPSPTTARLPSLAKSRAAAAAARLSVVLLRSQAGFLHGQTPGLQAAVLLRRLPIALVVPAIWAVMPAALPPSLLASLPAAFRSSARRVAASGQAPSRVRRTCPTRKTHARGIRRLVLPSLPVAVHRPFRDVPLCQHRLRRHPSRICGKPLPTRHGPCRRLPKSASSARVRRHLSARSRHHHLGPGSPRD